VARSTRNTAARRAVLHSARSHARGRPCAPAASVANSITPLGRPVFGAGSPPHHYADLWVMPTKPGESLQGADLAVGKVGIIRHLRRAALHERCERASGQPAEDLLHSAMRRAPPTTIRGNASGLGSVTPALPDEAHDHTSFPCRVKRNTWPVSIGLCRPGPRENPAKPSGCPRHRHNPEVGVMMRGKAPPDTGIACDPPQLDPNPAG
jgi:hypothetical protein